MSSLSCLSFGCTNKSFNVFQGLMATGTLCFFIISTRAVISWVTPTTAFLMRQLIVASRLGRTEYQLLLMKISWWDRNVKIWYKCLVVIDEFLTVSLYQPNESISPTNYCLRQAWCYLQVKLCDPRLSALSVVATIKALYKYTSFLSFPFLSPPGLTQWACYKKASVYGSRVGWTPARTIQLGYIFCLNLCSLRYRYITSNYWR